MNLAPDFEQALTAFNNGDLETAAGLCDALLRQSPQHADGQHLMALVRKKQGRVRLAEKHFRESLRARSAQPVVHSNLGNLLQQSHRYAEAEECYERAIKLMPGLADAWYHRGLMALQQGRHDKAIEYLEKAQSVRTNLNIELALINAYREGGLAEKASDLAATLRKRYAHDIRAVNAEARVIRDRDEEMALRFLEDKLELSPDPAAIHYELGLLHYSREELDSAAQHFEAAVRLQPMMIEAHRSLNELYWQELDKRFLASYRRAIEQAPTFGPLYHNLAAAHISSNDEESAINVLQEALGRAGRDPYLVHGLAVQHLKRGKMNIAAELLAEALGAAPDNVRFLNDFANLHIRAGDYSQAAGYIGQALEVEPHNQEVWAYQGLVWRLTGDDRHAWLNDYDDLLGVFELPTPNGFDSLENFMSELASYLATLHTAKRQPLDQSVRNGTQTLGMLFKDPHPLVADLKGAVETCLREYLGPMHRNRKHPFNSRIGQFGRFTGSWSVKLGSGGYHTNHVHPYGWLSCCNYISLPPLGAESSGDRSGWIRFGETSMGLDQREEVARAIKPEVGKCVFFPSYFWHGTYTFNSELPRMTVPCDIDPA